MTIPIGGVEYRAAITAAEAAEPFLISSDTERFYAAASATQAVYNPTEEIANIRDQQWRLHEIMATRVEKMEDMVGRIYRVIDATLERINNGALVEPLTLLKDVYAAMGEPMPPRPIPRKPRLVTQHREDPT